MAAASRGVWGVSGLWLLLPLGPRVRRSLRQQGLSSVPVRAACTRSVWLSDRFETVFRRQGPSWPHCGGACTVAGLPQSWGETAQAEGKAVPGRGRGMSHAGAWTSLPVVTRKVYRTVSRNQTMRSPCSAGSLTVLGESRTLKRKGKI